MSRWLRGQWRMASIARKRQIVMILAIGEKVS